MMNDSRLSYGMQTTTQDYFPFGMLMNNRQESVDDYRFGFNGKENDNEVKGIGNQQDYGMRIYDPRLGRFLSADPLIVQGQQYPWYSPYQFAGNKPILFIDMDGLEESASAIHVAAPLLKNPPAKFTSAQGGKFQVQSLNYGKGNDFSRAYTGMTGNEQVSVPAQGNTQIASTGHTSSEPSARASFGYSLDASIQGNNDLGNCQGNAHVGETTNITKQDAAVGLGVVGFLTGGALLIADGVSFFGVTSLGISIDDIGTNSNGESLVESQLPNEYKAAYNFVKTGLAFAGSMKNLKEIEVGKDYNDLRALGSISDFISSITSLINASSQTQDAVKTENVNDTTTQ